MPDNTVIEELLSSLNNNFDKQLRTLETLTSKFEEADSNGSTKEFVSFLAKEMDRVEKSINAQKDLMSSVYKEVSDKAKKRGENVNPEVAKDIYEFVRKLAEKQNQISQLNEELKSKGKYTKEERAKLSETIKSLKEEIKQLIEEKKNEYRQKYQKGSAELSALNNLSTQKKIEEVSKNIKTIQEGQELNLRSIYRAESENNRELKKTQEIWGVVKGAVISTWDEVSKGGNMWMKYNAQAISDAKRLGMTTKSEAMAYMDTLMENSKTLARNFGMTTEQAMKMQDAYVKVTGRASMLTTSQMEDIAAASKLMGDETVQSAIGIMDKMGSTSQATMELMDKNFVRAANSGLDTVKASEEFVKNMSLANKLNFRNGVDGISKMTILSQRIKMNLNEVASVADKFSTVEGAIEGSARLQMLGGAGAMFGGNPMQMMYEALSDPEALFERMGKMFSQQAVFDRRTGEAKIDPVQMQIMREQAKAMGMNPDEAIQSAKQQAKLNAIERDFSGYNPALFNSATEEQKAAIANKAEYDKETRTWKIKYVNEEGEEQVTDLSNITDKELREITKDNVEDVKDIRDHVRKIASELIGTEERWNSMKDQFTTGVSQMIGPVMKGLDTTLSIVNGLALWRLATGGGIGSAFGLVGLGAGKTGIRFAKMYGSKLFDRIGLKMFSKGGVSSAPGSRFAQYRKLIERGAHGGQITKNLAANGAISDASKVSNADKAIRNVGKLGKLSKIAKGGGAALAIVGGIVEGAEQWGKADAKYKSQMAVFNMANSGNNYTIGNRRYGERETAAMKTYAKNRQAEGRAGAVGAGVGAASGAMVGAAIGSAIPVLGTIVGGLVGGAIGSYMGSKYGRKVGQKLASTESDDLINAHLNEINKGDEEENFKKIVLPVESIDYNVSLIANQLGIMSATPARGNIYLEAEAAGELTAEGVPLQASTVNQVDTHVVNASQVYKATGPLTLNINGSIDLNLKGTNVGKLTDADIKQMFNNSPELQRRIAEIVTNIQVMNGNANRLNNESTDNRRGTVSNTYMV